MYLVWTRLLFEELVAIFSNIRQNRVLDAGPLFPSSYVWNAGPLYTEKFYRVKGGVFSTFDHLYWNEER